MCLFALASPVHTCSYLFRVLVQSCPCLFIPVHTCSSLFTPVHTCSYLFIPDHTCSYPFIPVLSLLIIDWVIHHGDRGVLTVVDGCIRGEKQNACCVFGFLTMPWWRRCHLFRALSHFIMSRGRLADWPISDWRLVHGSVFCRIRIYCLANRQSNLKPSNDYLIKSHLYFCTDMW